MKKIYISIFLMMFINLLWENSSFAESDGRWWNEKEIPSLNVIKDLKLGTGRAWYVDGANGNDDTGDGKSIRTAWKTIRRGVRGLKAGDTLVIAAGIYRERITINKNKNGMEGNRTVIGPLGNGEVIIDASEKIEGWSVYNGNIYKAFCSFKPTAVVVDERPLFPEFSLSNINEGKRYYDRENKTLYLYIPGGGNPSLHDIGVVCSDPYQDAILIQGAKYITLYGLTVRFTGGRGISILGDYNRVEKCNVKFNGGIGINMFKYRNGLTENTTVVKNHIYHNFLRNWPRGRGRYKRGGWGGGAVSHSTPDTYYIGNVVHKNGGEGLLAYGNKGAVWTDNIVYDNWSVNIYTSNESDCTIERNLVFCHEPDSGDLYNNGDENPKDGKNLRRLRAEGIMTADEGKPARFMNARIINNIIIGCRRGITHYAAVKDSGLKNVLVAYNTIVVPNKEGVGEKYIGIRVPYNHGNNVNVVYRNNIVYASYPKTYLLDIGSNKADKDIFHGLTFENNLWYHSSNPKPFQLECSFLNIHNLDFNNWSSKCKIAGACSKNMFCDPKLLNITQYSADAVKLKPDSPAINSAIPIKEIIIDYNGNNRTNDPPDIGAFELKLNNEK